MDSAGCDSRPHLAHAGLDLKALDHPTLQCSLELSIQLWESALEATGDPAFGVKAGSYVNATTFHSVSGAIAASSTLMEAFERVHRYSFALSDAVEYEFVRRRKEYIFVIKPTTDVPDASVDCLVATYVRMCRSLIGRDFAPIRIELSRSPPANLDDYAMILRSPMRFNASQTRLVLDAESIERRLDGANPALARRQDQLALRYLRHADQADIPVRVRDVLMQRLPYDESSERAVATLLNLSVRALRQKLGDSGKTYKDMLDDTRREWALAYLGKPHGSIDAAAYLLGYSSTAGFSRAFRRWTGLSPTGWHARQYPDRRAET
ncbi:MAG: AraC family transcriptional regulator [Steroidobacteraceae bacterium]